MMARRLAVVLAAALAGAFFSIGSAWADTQTTPPPDEGSTGSSSSSAAPSGGDTTSDGKTGNVGGCAVVAVPSYLGLSCAGAGGGEGETAKQILDGDPVPGCWDEPVTDAELAAMGLSNQEGAGGYTYYWYRCLHGIDKKTAVVGPDGMSITPPKLITIDNGDKVVLLTQNQQRLVQAQEKNSGVPAPKTGVTPSSRPRVGQWVSFVDVSQPRVVTVDAGVLRLRATETRIDVEPLGAGKGMVSCPDSGVVATGETPPNDVTDGGSPFGFHQAGCWYRYDHSSIDEDDEAYSVNMTAHWDVETSPDGVTWTHFTDFTKSQVTEVPVTEIQTLVVD